MIDTTTSPRRSGMAGALRRAALPLALLAVLAGCNSTTPPGTDGQAAAAGIAGSGTSPETSPEIRRIEALGRTIYVLDNAAARATDLLLAEGVNPQIDGIRGWVTETSGSSGVLVRFLRQKGDHFEAAYDVTIDEGGRAVAMTRSKIPALTPDQSAQLAARQLAMSSFVPLCPPPYTYNTVVFRDPETRDWRVYLLAATTDPQVRMYGGHHRFLISSDGDRILSSDRLSNGCISPRLVVPEGYEPSAYVTTEVLSQTPTEAHVFASLLYRLPLVVIPQDRGQWFVDRGRMWRVK
jgi:hypothetical protein